ncbi:MAG: DNA repair protein RadC [Paenibacillaceae bacterium]|uniref:RadC family protein n=1 Tax=Paenibacillus cymbidii TaxID=1639034 RepID=UPI0010804DDF|nr:DNA repair protein RadC [Paenibacillus cymbidii]MBO9607684.1 DNA repair protein RadC [Paenibacillaceae bacterium]
MESHNLLLRDVPNEERPRERMQHVGAHALSNAELVAILLRTGTVSESATRLAQRLLKESGTLRNLADFSLAQLTAIRGIGPAKALQVLAGIELGRRMSRTALHEKPIISSPGDAAMLLMEEMRHLQKEHFVCLFLNTKNEVIAKETLSIGSLNATLVHPREVFRSAIKQSSAAIICAHNHPSGDPTPSREDIHMTERLVEAGRIVGIDLLDHLVLGDGVFVSLKEKGYM